eukprot:403338716
MIQGLARQANLEKHQQKRNPVHEFMRYDSLQKLKDPMQVHTRGKVRHPSDGNYNQELFRFNSFIVPKFKNTSIDVKFQRAIQYQFLGALKLDFTNKVDVNKKMVIASQNLMEIKCINKSHLAETTTLAKVNLLNQLFVKERDKQQFDGSFINLIKQLQQVKIQKIQNPTSQTQQIQVFIDGFNLIKVQSKNRRKKSRTVMSLTKREEGEDSYGQNQEGLVTRRNKPHPLTQYNNSKQQQLLEIQEENIQQTSKIDKDFTDAYSKFSKLEYDRRVPSIDSFELNDVQEEECFKD